MSASESPETAFWRFSLETYARPGVAEAAIALQDTDGANVNLLLLCLWLAHEKGQSLTGDRLASLSEALAAWSASVTAPLRSVRRSLKTPPPVVADGAAVLKAAVQALELDA
ncbi:MAG: TIGR02444 family protein, partial [Alphaproteobacteria bacterium]